jgi:hypothetical protein
MQSRLVGVAVATALLSRAPFAFAQGAASVEERLQKLEAEQAAMKQQIEQRDARIQELERQLRAGGQSAAAPIVPVPVPPGPETAAPAPMAAAPSPEPAAVAAEAAAAAAREVALEQARQPTQPKYETWGVYDPGDGFVVGRIEHGELDISAYALARYMNQNDSDGVFIDHAGNERPVDTRNDIFSHRIMVFLKGWLMDPRLIYNIVLWTVNATDQQAIFANVGYQFSKKFSLYAGLAGNPGSRSLLGSHPFWLGNDRVMADEFFRPYFGSGIYATGELFPGFWYNALLSNNNSALGVTASQLDREFTRGASVWWMPSTHEFGPRGAYGDWEWHQEVATRFGFSTVFSPEQSFADGGNNPENTTLRLADSVNLFETGALAPGVTIANADYGIYSVDAGIKYRGMFLQAEYYWRRLSNFDANGVIPVRSIDDSGFYVQGSFYPIPKKLELYAATSQIFGDRSAGFGDSSEYLVGMNYYPYPTRNHRLNLQVMDVNRSPVSSTFGYYTGGQDGWTVATAFSIFF